ncbi:molybdate ABC transporter substrate-binding protein [Spiribacter vilamensis]|uniref:Molybdate transport system substrate-binding protein n=1 Tax=Spiribacter vilamensis TaxID=531306 RepID=A0A4Q8D215_9GAMM|nr:molybdate ABC transporter substrate-binding protein [Spiribacter vilamensis]RZU99364.1 molybdate transport system substrate-binding protein [Spiribacter vilamensis]TVO61655.1 molybdate ABC transporter substrate-binding protein [Spiribacter vilamensis]
MGDRTMRGPRKGRCQTLRQWLLAMALLTAAVPAGAAPLHVAVASNFLTPLETLADAFAEQGGGELLISAGATGQLYTQITNGAPYDVFLAADQARPQRLVDEGLARADRHITYARGQLVLWARPGIALPAKGLAGLRPELVTRLAIANPALAPYGRAAREALEATGQWAALEDRIVQGQNVGQAFQYLATGNVSHALVAASYTRHDNRPAGAHQVVDTDWHAPVRQDAVILERTDSPDQALAFLAFMQGPAATGILQDFGYQPMDESQ